MAIRELIKQEVDQVQEQYLDALYRIIKAFISPITPEPYLMQASADEEIWQEFVNAHYGIFADEPLERGEQGEFEVREALK